MYPLINIFGREIGSYALCTILGLIVCTIFATVISKKYKVYFEDLILIILVIIGGLVIGSHILYFLTNIDTFISFINEGNFTGKQLLNEIIKCGGGMVFYGGFIGGLLGLKIYLSFAHKDSQNTIMNIFALCVPLFHTFGRIGCFFGGCCYGIESNFGYTITNNVLYPSVNGVRRFPVSLVEAIINLILFIILFTIFRKINHEIKLIYFYMLFYSIARFCLEFFRGDEIRGVFWGLSTSQWISIVLFIVSLFHFIFKKSGLKENIST